MPSLRRCGQRPPRFGTARLSQRYGGKGSWACLRQGRKGIHHQEPAIVVGADGAFSKVREALAIPADVHLYPDAYLIAILESAEPISESFYYVGHRQILGLFLPPVTRSICFI